MKKLFIWILFFIGGCNTYAQNTRFRTDTLKNKAQQVSTGYAIPHLINITNAPNTTFDTVVYIKFYDQSTRPFSTSVPVLTICVPQGTTSLLMNQNIRFNNAMWIRQSKSGTDNDTTVHVSSEPIVEITY